MSQADPVELLERLSSPERDDGWKEFLARYSPLILGVLGLFESDQDRIADAYLFVCETLRRDGCRRLRGFSTDGRASFDTWLRAVVRNGYLDWRRQAHGRLRPFASVRGLPPLEQEVYRQVFEQRNTQDEAFHLLRAEYPGLGRAQVSEIVARLYGLLTRRQRWLLSVRGAHQARLGFSTGARGALPEPSDPQRSPEQAAGRAELLDHLEFALGRLEARQRLLLRLRYEQELTLREVAEIVGLSSPQAAARQIDTALAELKSSFDATPARDRGES